MYALALWSMAVVEEVAHFPKPLHGGAAARWVEKRPVATRKNMRHNTGLCCMFGRGRGSNSQGDFGNGKA